MGPPDSAPLLAPAELKPGIEAVADPRVGGDEIHLPSDSGDPIVTTFPGNSARLIDVPNPRVWAKFGWRTAIMPLAGMVVGGVLGILFMLMFAISPIAMLSGVLLCQIGFWVCARRIAEWRAEKLIKKSQDSPAKAIALLARAARQHHPISFIPRGVKALAATGHRGIAFRIGRVRDLASIDPIRVPFEPLPLSRAEPNFRALTPNGDCSAESPSQCVVSGASDTRGATLASAAETNEISQSRAAGRPKKSDDDPGLAEYLAGVSFLGVVFYFFARGLYEFINTGTVPTRTALIVSLFVTTIVLASWLGIRIANRRLLVPGGLLIRVPPFFVGKYSLNILRNSECLLCVFPDGLRHWQWVIADGKSCYHGFAVASEIQVLLRAWFSPVPTPPLDQLSDLE